VGVGHDVVPHQRRDGAAGHALGRRIVVVAHPHRAGEIARVADEPGVTPAVGRAGLAGDLDTVELGPFAGAVFDHRVHHRDHVEGDLRADHLLRPLAVAVEAPHQFARAGPHFKRGVRGNRLAEIGESRIGNRVLEHVYLVGADRQRRRIGQRRVDTEVARGLNDLGAAELGVAVAKRDRKFDRNDVDRVGDGVD
jgi:hypothetical protein